MLHLLQMGPSKVLTTFPFQIQSSWQLSLLQLPPCCTLLLSPRTPLTCIPPLYNLPPRLMLHSRPTLVSKPLIPICPFYILPLCPLTSIPCSWLSFCASCFLSPRLSQILQWNAGGLRARSTKLLHFLSSHPVDLICIQESNLNSSSSFRIPGFSALRSDRTHSRSGIVSPDATYASGNVVIFIRQGLSFSELSTSSFSLLDAYSNYVGVNISLNNSSSLSCLNVYATSICSSPTDSRTDSFSFSILSSSRNLFILGDFNCHHPLWDSRSNSDPRGEEVFDWVISSDLLPLNNPNTPTLLHRFSPDISFAPLFLPFLAHGRCFRTWVLTTYQFFYLSLFLLPIAPTSAPLPSTFRKLAGMTLPPTLTLTVFLRRNTRLFLFPLLLLSLLL